MSHDDALSLSMFWAGALMVFAPIIFFATVIGVWWYQRKREAATKKGDAASASPSVSS